MAILKRIVCYAINGSGMGHVTRLSSVATWLRRYASLIEGRVPEVLFLSSSEADSVLLDAGFASFKLPSKTIVRATGMNVQEYKRLSKQFVWQQLGLFAPDLLVVDTIPSGSFDELLQVLDGPFRKAFIMRQVKPEYGQRPIYQAAARLYDVVVAPHHEGENPQSLNGIDAASCGEVLQVERGVGPGIQEARRELGVLDDRPLVYVSAGGGGDPTTEATLMRIVEALADERVHLLIGAGPLYRGRRIGGEHITFFSNPGISRYFEACDAAVSAGGYNTFAELLHIGVPSIFFAQEKIADDQLERIERAEQAGACLVWRDQSDTESLRNNVRRALTVEHGGPLSDAARAFIPSNGARLCARLLLRGVYSDAQLAWAARLLTPGLAAELEAHGPEGRDAIANWLPRLMPEGQLETLGARPEFQALLRQLGKDAADEVRATLSAQSSGDAIGRLEVALRELLAEAHGWPGGINDIVSLVDNALKKHPIRQQEADGRVDWLCEVLGWVCKLVTRSDHEFRQAELIQIYRVFPRVVDATASQAWEVFEAVVATRARQGATPTEIVQSIRALKFAHRRITLDLVQSLTEAR